jgi:hypothetical protein
MSEVVQWGKVKLLFVRSVNETKQQASKHDWALFKVLISLTYVRLLKDRCLFMLRGYE